MDEFMTRHRAASRSPERARYCHCWMAAIPLAAAAVSAGAQIYSSNQQRRAAESAANQQSQAAQAAASAPKQQQAQAPDQNTLNAGLGIGTGTNNVGAASQTSNTLLTGAQGVQDPLSINGRRLYGSTTTDLLGA